MKKLVLAIAVIFCAFIKPVAAQNKVVAARFNQSLQDYYELKNALATDKPAEAAQLATTLQASIKEVPHQGFASDAQHQLWMQQSAIILPQLAELATKTDLDGQRKNFREISTAFVVLATELKLNTKKAFVQYCPMGKYTWLNEVKDVQNPFWGSKMYDCGEVKSTISRK